MQEFSTVTASSYDAESLAPMLTEKAAEGWDVVSIVAAGTNIVAYLRREGDAQVAAGSTVSADETEAATTTEAADEPAGWAAAPENEVTESASADDATGVDNAAGAAAAGAVGAAGAAATAETLDTAGDAGSGLTESATEAAAGATDQAGAAADQATDAAAVAEVDAATADSGVPAGWYADPSGRYELRYWDGNAWTEHVSRAGQQFTDPPVA